MSSVPEFIRDFRDRIANTFIGGRGIEIGAGNAPIRFGSGAVAQYVDFATKEELVAIHGFADDWTAPDIVDDAESLESIALDSLDFLVACHVLEHTQDPLRVLKTWFSKLHTGGVAFIAVPDRRFCFDRDRPLTTVEHLWSDYESGPHHSEDAHLHEWVTLANGEWDESAIELQKSELKRIDYRIHYHVWETTSFLDTLVKLNGKLIDFEVEHCGRNHVETIAVLRKR